jgi:replicative DNA helicase
MGKTAFALNVAEYVAVEKGIPVCVFSLEMAKEQIAQRLLCSRARISAHQLKTGRIADHQWTNLSIAVGPLSEAPIYLDDSASLTVMDIRAKARRLKLRYDIGMVVVDYLQLVRGRSDAESRQQEITYVSQSLKALSRELKIPVVALSQLSRQVEIRGKDARPQLSDLRESGAIEQDADVVLFIHRPRDEEGYLGSVAEIIIGKQRNGPTGIIKLAFVKDIVRFELLDIHHGSPHPEEQY